MRVRFSSFSCKGEKTSVERGKMRRREREEDEQTSELNRLCLIRTERGMDGRDLIDNHYRSLKLSSFQSQSLLLPLVVELNYPLDRFPFDLISKERNYISLRINQS